jgi:DNA-binding SARP family transcriptional activator
VITDCHLFEHLYAEGKLCLSKQNFDGAAAAFRAGLKLYRGDYLLDHPYAEWTHQFRAHFSERRLNALAYLCEHALLMNNPAGALEYAQEILAIDNLRERTHRVLMRANYNMGQRACAVRQYKICAAYLQQELGVEPSLETQRLYQAIRDDTSLPNEEQLVAAGSRSS